MKTMIAALVAATTLVGLGASAASAQPYRHGWHHGHHPHRVCVWRHHRQICSFR